MRVRLDQYQAIHILDLLGHPAYGSNIIHVQEIVQKHDNPTDAYHELVYVFLPTTQAVHNMPELINYLQMQYGLQEIGPYQD